MFIVVALDASCASPGRGGLQSGDSPGLSIPTDTSKNCALEILCLALTATGDMARSMHAQDNVTTYLDYCNSLHI